MRRIQRSCQRADVGRTAWCGLMAMLLSVNLLLAGLQTVRADEKSTLPEAVAQLKKEQTLAESYAGLLKEYGSTDLRTYARGISLYAEAKAEFDGLIEQMITALHQGKAPDTSEVFQRQLTKAVDRRVVFTSFMVDEILNKIPESERSLAAVLRGYPETCLGKKVELMDS